MAKIRMLAIYPIFGLGALCYFNLNDLALMQKTH